MPNAATAVSEGIGAYTLTEAARYARMSPQTLNRWFFGNPKSPALRTSGIEGYKDKRVTFEDFVEALAIRSLRIDYKLSLSKINEAIQNAFIEHGITHPFSRKDHRTILVGKELHILLQDDPENPVGLTGKDKGQKSMRPCIQAYLQDLDYTENGIDKLYRAFQYQGETIILDPTQAFGTPIVENHGYPAEVLWRAALAEGSFQRAADLYEVPEAAVAAAYRYWNQELGMAA